MWVDFDVRNNRRWTFLLEEALLWIVDLYFGLEQRFEFKNILMDLFLTNSFSLHKTLTDGLEWCGLLVMFLSVVWTLILTAPIHCRGSIAEQMWVVTSYIYFWVTNTFRVYFKMGTFTLTQVYF